MTTTSSPDLALVARAIADDSRAAMLLALLDGRAWTATELAKVARVSRSTTTTHLHRLVSSGLVSEVRQGRHRYVRLVDETVADALEALSALSPATRPAAPSLTGQRADARLREARTCYHHLAGRLGVRLADGWRATGAISEDWQLTEAGRAWCDELGVSLPTVRSRPLVRPCLDWTERREHAAGAMPDAFATTAFERGWLERGPQPRAVRVTPAGRRQLAALDPG